MCNILTYFNTLILVLCLSLVCLILYGQSNLSCCVRRGGVAWPGGSHHMVLENLNLTWLTALFYVLISNHTNKCVKSGTSSLLTTNVDLFRLDKLKKCDPRCVDNAETFQSGRDQIRLHPPSYPRLPPAQPSPALLCLSRTGSCFRGFNLQISILVLDTGPVHWWLD